MQQTGVEKGELVGAGGEAAIGGITGGELVGVGGGPAMGGRGLMWKRKEKEAMEEAMKCQWLDFHRQAWGARANIASLEGRQ